MRAQRDSTDLVITEAHLQIVWVHRRERRTVRRRFERRARNLRWALRATRTVHGRTHATAEQMRMVVRTFRDNAIKHTPAPERVSLAAEPARNVLRIRVSDAGVGIPREENARSSSTTSTAWRTPTPSRPMDGGWASRWSEGSSRPRVRHFCARPPPRRDPHHLRGRVWPRWLIMLVPAVHTAREFWKAEIRSCTSMRRTSAKAPRAYRRPVQSLDLVQTDQLVPHGEDRLQGYGGYGASIHHGINTVISWEAAREHRQRGRRGPSPWSAGVDVEGGSSDGSASAFRVTMDGVPGTAAGSLERP